MSSLEFYMIFVFLYYLSSSLFTFSSAANPTYHFHYCSDENFTTNSAYQSNLNSLLSSLSSYAKSSDGFSNATAGQDPNRVYGVFQCRGDATNPTCRDCVAFASREATQRCPAQKGAVLWYDECLLHYNDSDFFSTAVQTPGVTMYKTNNITIEPYRFRQLLLSLMTESATQAANEPKRFATRKGDSTSQTLYTLVQCTQDLSNTSCSRCLQRAISGLTEVSIGGWVLLPSCHCRFEVYLFDVEKETLPPASTLSPPPSVTRPEGKSRISSSIIVAIVVPVTASVLLFVVASYCFLIRRAKKKGNAVLEETAGNDISTIEDLQFDLGTIQAATNNFSTENKLGEGGFGEVYKGVLPNGQVIAVKRLSKHSIEGAEQFKNEVVLVAKLHHRNLVRLLGFCLEGEEKILVYEFMPNKSLDYFLFDPETQRQLDWSTRYNLIVGIARGILYLHEDSQLKIIHRDLKISNILLDSNMSPKISDFGMAKVFAVDQTQGKTNRVVGTCGYISPKYAIQGQLSVKSDVYSFGVLILEIITGKKNNSFYQKEGDFLSYAWTRWREGTPLELLDSTLTNSYSENQVIRCIQLGLLCVQENPDARPTMANVVLMLDSYSITLQSPQHPAFFFGTGIQHSMQITKETDPDQSKGKYVYGLLMMLQSLTYFLAKCYKGVLQVFFRK